MDPYLEHPIRWPGVHDGMIAAMRAELNKVLLPNYVAVIGERCRVLAEEGNTYTEEHVQTFLEIRDTAMMQRVVTEIEILSPINKIRGDRDHESYLQKQRELLHSQTHLLEIDLLRTGAHTVATCSDSLYVPPDWDYIVCLHRAATGIRFETWPIRLEHRLPRVSVPLDEGTPDAILDVQVVFDRNYDEGAYGFQIDYRENPTPPLTEKQEQFANAILTEKKLR